MVEDPVGDLLARLKNAGAAQHLSVSLPRSQFLVSVAETLAEAGYVDSVDADSDDGAFAVDLAYDDAGKSRIVHAKRLSRPARRSYVSVSDIPDVRGGRGDVVLSTPKGVLTGEKARQQHVGGEILFEIW